MSEAFKESSDVRLGVTEGVLDVERAASFATGPGTGAVCVFVGTARRFTADRVTERLFYECYHDMALEAMESIVREARKRWQLQRCAVVHRTGWIEIEEASVVVAVGCAHRAEAFEACRFLIDRLKQEVPIWKRERFANGSENWVEGAGTSDS